MALSIKHDYTLLESVKFQLKLIIPGITDRQIGILAYMIIYPEEYKDKIVQDDISTSKGSLAVRLSQMEDIGILEKIPNTSERRLLPGILNSIQLGNFTYTIDVNLITVDK